MKKNGYFRLLEQLSKPLWLVIIIAIYLLFQYAFNGMFRFSMSHLHKLSGATIPDVMFYYTPAQLETIFRNFGAAGIEEYLNVQLVDMAYPLSYATLLAVLLFLGYGATKYRSVTWLPVAAAVADYTENLLIRYLAIHFPETNRTLAQIAAFFTAWKWIFIAISILLILSSFVLWAVRKIKPAG